MGLLEYLNYLPSHDKTEILGEKTTKYLRYSFANENNILNDNILDEAVALKCGSDFYHKIRYRELLLRWIPLDIVRDLGFENHNQIKNEIVKNKIKFADLIDLEEEYRLDKPVDDRQSLFSSKPIYGKCNGKKAFPHEYQYLMKKKILDQLLNYKNPNLLVTLPTGAGKTVLAMEVIIDLLRLNTGAQNLNIMWLVNTIELAEQSLNSFEEFWKQKGDHEVLIRRYFERFNQINQVEKSSITFSTYDLLINRLSDPDVQSYLNKCDYLVIDEAHYSEADEYSKVITLYKELNHDYRVLALTATPFRNMSEENERFKNFFKNLIQLSDVLATGDLSPIGYLQEKKYLSKVICTPFYEKEWQQKDEKYYNDLHNSVFEICKNITEVKDNMIIFAESMQHAIALSIFLKKKGLKNGLIIGDTPVVTRKKLLNEFGNKNSDLNLLVNHGILATGIDVPGMNAIMILRDIGSPTLALQILGRAMRGPENNGNEVNDVYLTKTNFDFLSQYKLLEETVLN